MRRYNPKDIEPKWQKVWDESKLYSADLTSDKPKYVGFGMFNYPSGAGIHVGHVRNYTIPDVITRVKRQQGFEAYQPVGWDSFGLPAENFAIKTGVSPQESTKKAIDKYHKQYRAMGWAVDWDKEINTTDPEYYKWTQWTFLKLFEQGLAYQKESPQWWCPHDKTVLADEQVEAGRCWRCGHVVERKNLKQWFFKITDYADEMLDDTEDLDWTDAVKASQKAWIGKSQGALITFAAEDSSEIQVFTTRADTIFGATYLVLAPEHPLVKTLVTDEYRQPADDYIKEAGRKSDLERQEGAKHKTGVFTGAYAINPANKENIPIWIADYVLMGYGTGAIMAVPAHDERDNEFAQKFNLPITEVVARYHRYEGKHAVRDGLETLQRKTIDAIIKNKDGKILLMDDGDVHFVGGGIEEGETEEQAVRREVAEESGYVDIAQIRPVTGTHKVTGYRATKNKNQETAGKFYEVILASDQTVKSEIDEGLHKISWVDPEEVEQLITWEGHRLGWLEYQAGSGCYAGEGVLINSGQYDGMSSSEVREQIVKDLPKAKEQTNYRMRDWLISRQRYWGAPIPIIHCPKCGAVAVPEKDLPVVLPDIKDYEPTGGNASVLAGVEDWVNVKCPDCGGQAKRETDTMDGYVCSSWYFMRYLSPRDNKQAWDPALTQKWMPINFYNGADHATAHLLYARFYTRFFHKQGLVGSPEPFTKMVYNGKVKAADGSAFSKTLGNGVDPLEIIEQGYGADSLRLYEMFAAPVELDLLWDAQGVPGAYRFLSRVWTLVQDFLEAGSGDNHVETAALARAANKTAKKVTHQVEDHRFNTAIAAMMELCNELYKTKAQDGIVQSPGWRQVLETLVQLLAPFAPHITEEMWSDLGHSESVHISNWPTWDEALVAEEMITLAIQINGKVRAEIVVETDISETDAIIAAKASPKIAEQIAGKTIKKEIYVPGRLVSLVV